MQYYIYYLCPLKQLGLQLVKTSLLPKITYFAMPVVLKFNISIDPQSLNIGLGVCRSSHLPKWRLILNRQRYY